jgi:signal transduction histidine kinase
MGFDGFQAVERGLAATAETQAMTAAAQAVVAATTGIAGSVLLVAAFTAYLTRTIVRPVRRAATMAGRLAGGDLAVRLPPTGAGEIASLEAAFNTMASSLETSHRELRRLVEEQGALRRVATLVARAVPPPEVFEAVAGEVAGLLGAPAAWLAQYGSDGAVNVVATWGEPAGQVGARVDAPIVVDGRLWGIIGANWIEPGEVPAGVEDRLTQFTELVATAIANADSRAELNASRARVVAAADETRRRIERDLHDGTQQRLVALALDIRAAETAVPSDLVDLKAQLSNAIDALNGAVDDLREISRGIHPAILSKGGLGAALKSLARRSAVPVRLRLSVDRRLPEQVEVAVYYLASEALTNVIKHAGATMVEVELEAAETVVRLTIGDDGIGGARPERGSGLIGLRDRIEALGGRIEIASSDGGGTRLVAEIPLAAP